MILRNFLFLDTDTVSDYLSTLEGYIEEEVDQTQTERERRKGELPAGSQASEAATQTKRRLAVTDAAQFQRLYELLQSTDDFRYLDRADFEIWNSLQRNKLLEVQVTLRIPRILLQLQQAQSMAPYIELMKLIGQDPLSDPKTEEAFVGITSLNELLRDKPVPLLFEFASTPRFKFFASLPHQYLRCNLADLQGEATVFGKVHRIIDSTKKEEVYSILPEMEALVPTRKQRQALQSKRSRDKYNEILNGPASILIPIAVYR